MSFVRVPRATAGTGGEGPGGRPADRNGSAPLFHAVRKTAGVCGGRFVWQSEMPPIGDTAEQSYRSPAVPRQWWLAFRSEGCRSPGPRHQVKPVPWCGLVRRPVRSPRSPVASPSVKLGPLQRWRHGWMTFRPRLPAPPGPVPCSPGLLPPIRSPTSRAAAAPIFWQSRRQKLRHLAEFLPRLFFWPSVRPPPIQFLCHAVNLRVGEVAPVHLALGGVLKGFRPSCGSTARRPT